MRPALFLVINNSSADYNLINSEYSDDNVPIKAKSISLIPEVCRIPFCSGARYFNNHHVAFSSDNVEHNFYIWSNDDDSNKCFYSTTFISNDDSFNKAKEFPGNPNNVSTGKVIIIAEDRTLKNGRFAEF